WEGAQVCFKFARDFYLASDNPQAAAEVAALAARTFASDDRSEADAWYRDALGDADDARATVLGAELAVEHAELVERTGAPDLARTIAEDAARRCAFVNDLEVARPLVLRTRMELARLSEDPAESLRHVDGAFEIALDLRDLSALGSAMELVVTGLVKGRYTAPGWKLVDRFRKRLGTAGFTALEQSAAAALDELYPLVADELEALEREQVQCSEPPEPPPLGDERDLPGERAVTNEPDGDGANEEA
ncbi:MAG TPA: hypothetical protein VLB44_25920, partial [Kofleriaceae bacterium]|nr:hypothetical protein [Kofleriaceae bacterium]